MPTDDRQPTLRAAWLGQELRALREGKNINAKDVAGYLGKAASSLSRLESGLYPARESEVIAYLDLCGIKDPHRRTDFLTMCHDVGQRGWWDGYEADVASSLMDRMWIEERTASMRVCDVTYLPGLLQIPEYAENLFRSTDPTVDSHELQRWLSFRMTRQHIITRHDPARLSCLIDSTLLRRVVGSKTVMRKQLDYLLDASKRPNIDIRLLDGNRWNGVNGPFEILDLTSPYPKVGYVTTSAGDICVEGDKVDYLSRTYDRLVDAALSVAASRKLILAERDNL